MYGNYISSVLCADRYGTSRRKVNLQLECNICVQLKSNIIVVNNSCSQSKHVVRIRQLPWCHRFIWNRKINEGYILIGKCENCPEQINGLNTKKRIMNVCVFIPSPWREGSLFRRSTGPLNRVFDFFHRAEHISRGSVDPNLKSFQHKVI